MTWLKTGHQDSGHNYHEDNHPLKIKCGYLARQILVRRGMSLLWSATTEVTCPVRTRPIIIYAQINMTQKRLRWPRCNWMQSQQPVYNRFFCNLKSTVILSFFTWLWGAFFSGLCEWVSMTTMTSLAHPTKAESTDAPLPLPKGQQPEGSTSGTVVAASSTEGRTPLPLARRFRLPRPLIRKCNKHVRVGVQLAGILGMGK